MKKSILSSIAFMAILLAFTSCGKDDPVITEQEVLTGKFEIYIDGSLYSEGITAEVGSILDDQQNDVNTVTIADDGISIVVSQFPLSIGEVAVMDADSDPGVTIMTDEDYYGTVSGSLTRESGRKISFEGKCSKLLETEEHTVSGYVEAEVWENID
jgi:hypothetical protein